MWRICKILISCFLSATNVLAEENIEYFPDQENCELGAYMHCGHVASILGELDEPSLLGSRGYRFYWSRSFHHQVIIRIDIDTFGNGTLSAKIFDDSRDLNLVGNKEASLNAEALEDIKKYAFKVRTWIEATDTPESSPGLDGAGWCFEIASEDQFNAACRWSPMAMPPIPITDRNRHVIPEWRKTDADFHALGTEMIKLSGMDFGPIY